MDWISYLYWFVCGVAVTTVWFVGKRAEDRATELLRKAQMMVAQANAAAWEYRIDSYLAKHPGASSVPPTRAQALAQLGLLESDYT